ncbi:MAG: HlyD family efflux transporter periplasmic adaptor subunit [Tahibacter sp.]
MSANHSVSLSRVLLEQLLAAAGQPTDDAGSPAALSDWAQRIGRDDASLMRDLQASGLLSTDPLGSVPEDQRQTVARWMRDTLPAQLRDAGQAKHPWWLTAATVDADWSVLSATAPDGRLFLGFARNSALADARIALLRALPDECILAITTDASLWTKASAALNTDALTRIELIAPEPAPAPVSAPAPNRPSLFRSEVKASQSKRLDGDVLLVQPVALRLLGYGAAAAAILLIVVAFFGRFAKTETAAGVLLPTSGVTKVTAAQSGVVTKLSVKPGDLVAQGQHLLTVADARVSGGNVINRRILEELEQSITRTGEERAALREQAERERRELIAAQQTAQGTLVQVERQHMLQQQREVLMQEKTARLEKLLTTGVIAQAQLQDQHDQLISTQLSSAGLAREAQQARAVVRQAQASLDAQPAQLAARLSELEQRTSEYKQRLAEASLRSGVELTAPRAGRVAAVLVEMGEHVSGERTAVLLVNDAEPLQAQLFVPTRGVGFLHAGQEVRLRLQAFPYQRFGYQQGEIVEVSRATLAPNEVDMPVPLREPVYTVRVAMSAQSITAFGKAQALQAGMLLDADIVTDRPRIIEWILEPLFSLRGRH